jgi:NAD(P)-dependent dehydrogenase (short-subunit alcohol dehydrogenase family)
MVPPQGSQTKQGYELQLGTNCIGPFLFTKLVTPLLISTAKIAPAGSVRVVWVSSSAARGFSPNGGVEMGNVGYHVDKGAWHKYGVSKAGNILHAKVYAQRYEADGVVSVVSCESYHPEAEDRADMAIAVIGSWKLEDGPIQEYAQMADADCQHGSERSHIWCLY